jgi:hypothetical protein
LWKGGRRGTQSRVAGTGPGYACTIQRCRRPAHPWRDLPCGFRERPLARVMQARDIRTCLGHPLDGWVELARATGCVRSQRIGLPFVRFAIASPIELTTGATPCSESNRDRTILQAPFHTYGKRQ